MSGEQIGSGHALGLNEVSMHRPAGDRGWLAPSLQIFSTRVSQHPGRAVWILT
jgi:hypothetical protein